MPKSAVPDLAVLQASLTPIHPEDSIAEAGRKVLLSTYMDMLNHQDYSSDFNLMHASTQQIYNAVQIFKPYYQSKFLKPILKNLRHTMQLLNKVRRIDLLIKHVQLYQTQHEDEATVVFLPILEKLKGAQEEASGKLQKWLASKNYLRFQKALNNFINTKGLGNHTSKIVTEPYQVRHLLAVMIHQQLAQVRAFDGQLETHPERWRTLWIDCRWMSYLLNFFGDNLGTSAHDFMAEITIIQNHLSHIHELFLVNKHISKHRLLSVGEIATLVPYQQILEAERDQLIAEFAELWAHFNTRTVQRKLSDALLSIH